MNLKEVILFLSSDILTSDDKLLDSENDLFPVSKQEKHS